MFAWSEVCGERPAVMGIVNVTPDSFSDGGRFLDADAAVAHGLGAGGGRAPICSTSAASPPAPAPTRWTTHEELRRVLPVVGRLAAESGVPVSIDTSKAAVAAAALAAGATVVNDVAAGRRSRHVRRGRRRRRRPRRDAHAGRAPHDAGTIRTTTTSWSRWATSSSTGSTAARAAGIAHRVAVRRPRASASARPRRTTSSCSRDSVSSSRAVDVPVLVGTVAQGVHRRVLGDDLGHWPGRRDDGTLATVVWAVDHGARIVRVHDVRRRVPTRCGLLDGDGPHRRGGGGVKGRWAQGLEPRAFCWIIKDRLAASERPGGFARNHRKVRRQEELIWLIGHGFTHILSMLDSPHNLHAYDEAGIPHAHVPIGRHDEWPDTLPRLYAHAGVVAGQPAGARARSTTRSSATACSGCSPGTCSTPGSSPRVRTRRSSSRRSPAASSARWRARSSPSPSTRASSSAAASTRAMGTIVIKGLRELGMHGVLPEEQTRPQPFEVDVELTVDLDVGG